MKTKPNHSHKDAQKSTKTKSIPNKNLRASLSLFAAIPKNEIPVYIDTLATANEKGEREQFIANRELNSECRNAIDTAINVNTTFG